jgi:MFS family permease
VALVSIAHAFGVTTAAATWLVSVLYLATAVGQPAMGRLADVIGARRVYLTAPPRSRRAACSAGPAGRSAA